MTSDSQVKEEVRDFYDSIGWKQIGGGLYQNARYEDLRPVSQEYIHRCHLRVLRHLPSVGDKILDAGSGPIQYEEYLEYSNGFNKRVCLDLSIRALQEGRDRIGDHGMFVVGDVSRLPFRDDAFGGLVSMHTVHHLPQGDHERAYHEMNRVLKEKGEAVVVHSWGSRSKMMRAFRRPMKWTASLIERYRRRRGLNVQPAPPIEGLTDEGEKLIDTPGTFSEKHQYEWTVSTLGGLPGFDILVWRSVSPQFLRTMIHRRLLGKWFLRIVYWMEELAPHFFGRFGQYPMIVFQKGEPAVIEAEEETA